MANLNKVMLIGRLGQDPVIKETSSSSVANFSIATNENWTDKDGEKQERTEWHNIVAWDKLADLASGYLNKGSNIYCEGKLQTRSWETNNGEKKYRTEVVISQLQFLDKKEDRYVPEEEEEEEQYEVKEKPKPLRKETNQDLFDSMEKAYRENNPDKSEKQIREMMNKVNPSGSKKQDDIPF